MHKPSLTLSINPTYFCNFDCDFCYLTPDQLNDKEQLDLNILKNKILEIKEYYQIECVDLYGGEVGLLSKTYLENIRTLFPKETEFNVITNLSILNDFFYHPDIQISVSWEDNIRRSSEKVFKNIENIKRDINLLMLAGPQMLNWSEKKIFEVINKINTLKNIKSVEIKPYSSNQSNQLQIKYSQFEEHIKTWLKLKKDFHFVNEENLKNIFKGISNSFSDDHIYINPKGQFCVLEFDHLDNEYFKSINSIDDYYQWTLGEKKKFSQNTFCNSCEYFGNCLSEHLKNVDSLKHSCNGFKNLIEWYKDYEFRI